jgi:hypothetical protein
MLSFPRTGVRKEMVAISVKPSMRLLQLCNKQKATETPSTFFKTSKHQTNST